MNQPIQEGIGNTNRDPGDAGSGAAVERTATSGEPIGGDDIFVVTPDGGLSRTRLEYRFIEPAHLWRVNWLPGTAGRIEVVRDDHDSFALFHPVWPIAAGLLGVCPYLDPAAPFRTASEEELRAGTADIAAQLGSSGGAPVTFARITVPSGVTVHVVRPDLVYGTLRTHREQWRAAIADGRPPRDAPPASRENREESR